MQYYLCPRCKFHVAEKKNLCPTCGFDMLSLKMAQAEADKQASAKPSVWTKLFSADKKESAKEKPAMS